MKKEDRQNGKSFGHRETAGDGKEDQRNGKAKMRLPEECEERSFEEDGH